MNSWGEVEWRSYCFIGVDILIVWMSRGKTYMHKYLMVGWTLTLSSIRQSMFRLLRRKQGGFIDRLMPEIDGSFSRVSSRRTKERVCPRSENGTLYEESQMAMRILVRRLMTLSFGYIFVGLGCASFCVRRLICKMGSGAGRRGVYIHRSIFIEAHSQCSGQLV